MAVFFASVNPERGGDRCLYRLKCKKNDKGGNKLPKDSAGEPWVNANGHDMNELLGYIIGYTDFPKPTKEIQERLERFDGTKKCQMYGWDTPYFKNARINKQKGFFVYGVDVTIPLEESIVGHCGTDFKKYQISAGVLPEISNHLATMGLIEWKVYLDLERAFKQFI